MTRDAQVTYLREHSRPMEPVSTGMALKPGRMEGIRAVAFDVYGTLFCSAAGDLEDGGEEIEAAAFDELGLAGLTLADYRRVVREHQQRRRAKGVAHPEVEILEVWRELAGPDWVPEELCLAFECAAHPVWPMPGARECLDALRDRGLTLGIVSNAQFYTPLLFPALLGRELADWGITSDRIVLSHKLGEAKPSPRLCETLAAALIRGGIEPAETLFVGNDSRKDIAPAAATGFRTVLFAGDARSLRRDEPGVEPDRIVTRLDQISQLIV